MAWRIAPVELAITRETMLRSTPNCVPSIGRMKRRPMRISIPYGSSRERGEAKASGSTPTAMPSAVEWRKWKHIEDGQHDIED